jgi:hypothetical protein
MPYYREEFLNRATQQSHSTLGPNTVVQDSASILSYRSTRHQKALTSTLVSDTSADPYAYFLDNISRRRYQEQLKARGLQSHGSPDRGHAFEIRRHILSGQLFTVTDRRGPVWENAFIFPGPDFANRLDDVHAGGIETPAPYKEVGLDSFAQQAYARVAPTSVVFDAGQFLGELREGLPRLASETLKSGLKFYKGLGSDYLNVEFGWKPFVNDIVNAGKALFGATSELRANGERVHRQYSQPLITQSASASYSRTLTIGIGNRGLLSTAAATAAGLPIQVTGTSGGTASATYQKTRSVKRWFEGEFSSFYPLGFDPSDYFQKLNQLISIKLDPKTLWELAPWSWLVDWNLRIGDSIAANQMVANDLLVMHYGYAMEHTVYTTEVSWRRTADGTYVKLPASGRMFAATSTKRRIRANPYGFRTGGMSSLTGGQQAILGALGLTKLK